MYLNNKQEVNKDKVALGSVFLGVGMMVLSSMTFWGLGLVVGGSCMYLGDMIPLPKLVPFKFYEYEDLRLHIGVDRFRRVLSYPFDMRYSSLLISGKRGSGKSSVLKSILLNWFMDKDKRLEFYFIDMKRVELSLFKKDKRVKGFVYDNEGAKELLEQLFKMVEFMNGFYEEKGVVNIEEYNKITNVKQPYMVLVVEEFILLDKGNVERLNKLMAIGRSCGLLIIITMQRPESKTMGFIKGNLDYVIGFGVMNEYDSKVIGIEGLEDIKIKGRGKILSDKIEDFQGFLVDDEEIKKACQ